MTTLPRRHMSVPPPATFSPTLGYADVSELTKYALVSNIGKGSFGVISKVHRAQDGRDFAMKQLDYGKMTEKDRKQIIAEVAILESLKHKNIVQLVQKIKDVKNERIYIIMEYCTHGDLGSMIRKHARLRQPMNEARIWNIFLQITLALHHCHCPNEREPKNGAGGTRIGAATPSSGTQVLHRDLKPENVFMSGETVKLGDFGLSKELAGANFTYTYVGTPLYMPPEILAENKYDAKSDIWSLGCLVYEMCCFTSPFATATTQQELIAMVRSGKMAPLPSTYSLALRTVVKSMLSLNPVRRPTTKDLLNLEEMKHHRRLYALQQQMATFQARKDEFQRQESQLQERISAVVAQESALQAREAAAAEREAQLVARERAVTEGEDLLRENQRRIAAVSENLKGEWAKLSVARQEREYERERDREERQEWERERERDRERERERDRDQREQRDRELQRERERERERTDASQEAARQEQTSLRTSYQSQQTQQPGVAQVTSQIQSMWIAGQERGVERQAEFAPRSVEDSRPLPIPASRNRHPSYDHTPSKIPFPAAFNSPVPLDARLNSRIAGLPSRKPTSMPRRLLASKSLTNIAAKARGESDTEDTSTGAFQATPAKHPHAPGTPYRRAAQRTSIGSPGELDRVFQEDITMATASFYSPPPSAMSSPLPFLARRRKESNDMSGEPALGLPPSLIPAPTFLYRPDATPAKWQPDDPDLPSPFLRRTATGAVQGPAIAQPNLGIPHRTPLGVINPQSGPGGIGAITSASAGSTGSGSGTGSATGSSAGNGSGNGGSGTIATTAQGPRKLRRAKSGTLHQHVLRHNAARTSDAGSGPGLGASNAAGSGDMSGLESPGGTALVGGAVRTRPVMRDPARC